MARIRTLKPEFFRSPDTAKVSFPGRIFYEALWCWADDFGIGETNLNGLLGFAFPDEDGFTAQDLRRFCAEVAQHYGVHFYTVRGRHYYAVKTWEKHQKLERRTERRRNPTPDDPDATPDLRIPDCADSAPILRCTCGAHPREYGAGTGEQGNRGTGEVFTPALSSVQDARAKTSRGESAIARLNETARSVEAEQIARAYAENSPTPVERGLLTKVAVEIDRSLKSGIHPQQIADGLRDWHKSASWSTTQIQSFVHKAGGTRNGNGVGKPSKKALSYQEAAEALLAEMSQS